MDEIKNLSLNELKALVYDRIVMVEKIQNELSQINQEINKREKEEITK